jgi:hypothetical protein
VDRSSPLRTVEQHKKGLEGVAKPRIQLASGTNIDRRVVCAGCREVAQHYQCFYTAAEQTNNANLRKKAVRCVAIVAVVDGLQTSIAADAKCVLAEVSARKSMSLPPLYLDALKAHIATLG